MSTAKASYSGRLKGLFPFFAALVLSGVLMAAEDPSQQVTDAARNWLTLVDAGTYDQSWDGASKLFRESVTQAQWATAVKAAREPLGAVESRTAAAMHFATTLPGAPDGHYAVLQFHSIFDHKRDAIETVTMMIDDGTWKLAGYFIK
jgi:hypothetical protein